MSYTKSHIEDLAAQAAKITGMDETILFRIITEEEPEDFIKAAYKHRFQLLRAALDSGFDYEFLMDLAVDLSLEDQKYDIMTIFDYIELFARNYVSTEEING